MENPSKGFIFVASLAKPYYDAAILCAQSILDFYPEAKITLFTHKGWTQDEHRQFFDQVIEGIPAHCRAKLWALSRTPYDITAYIDADTYCEHEDVEFIFDQLGDADIVMTENRPYNSKVVYFTEDDIFDGQAARELRHYDENDKKLIEAGNCHRMRWHCGLFVYRKNEHTDRLWNDWFETTVAHHNTRDLGRYPPSIWYWDTFSFWRINHENNYPITIKRFPEPDARWNWVTGYREFEIEDYDETPIVFMHYSIPQDLIRRESINEADKNNSTGDARTLK